MQDCYVNYTDYQKVKNIISNNDQCICKPGKISFRLAGGLLLSRVSLNSAFLTGATGLTTSLTGSLTLAVATLGAPDKQTNQNKPLET